MHGRTSSAPGKLILTGEYAVVFGYPGIAVPSSLRMEVTYEESDELEIVWEGVRGDERWSDYIQNILELCGKKGGKFLIKNQLPLGKGMGSSTALIIAIARCLFGDRAREKALAIEDALSPDHSGIDFAVIWGEKPVRFVKGEEPEFIALANNLLKGACLIDTGTPKEETAELVAWVKSREEEVVNILKSIGDCTDRLQAGEDLPTILRDHHRAQVVLGVVPQKVQELIQQIESDGGAAKVLGAGGRTGGGGMVLAFVKGEVPSCYPVTSL